MATMEMFGGRGSGCLTPDPFIFSQSDESGKAMEAVLDPLADSGSQTPMFIREVNIEVLQSKLERLKTEDEQHLQNCSTGLPVGLPNNGLDADAKKVAIHTNLQMPYPVFAAMPPPPVRHPEFQFVRIDRVLALKAKPVKSHTIAEQVVSKGSVGHPFNCAPACKYVKRKGGCRDAEDCLSCHHCYWAKARATTEVEEASLATPQEEDARLREAKVLANKLVSLLGGEEPFGSKAQEIVKPKARESEAQDTVKPKAQESVKQDMSLGTKGHPLTCAEPSTGVRRKGGCMFGSSGQEAEAEAPSFHRTSYGEWSSSPRPQAEAEAPSFFGTSCGEAVQDGQDLDIEAIIAESYAAPVLSTNPAVNQTYIFPEPQDAPQHMPWCASVGSMGHPYTCGPACKYATKAKGCKDGAMCDHCHLCRWFRYGHGPFSSNV